MHNAECKMHNEKDAIMTAINHGLSRTASLTLTLFVMTCTALATESVSPIDAQHANAICDCSEKWYDILISLLPAVATFLGIWFACRSARIDQKISVAPQRSQVFSLYSSMIDCLGEVLHKAEENHPFTGESIRKLMDDWMFAMGNDERMKMLIRTGKIANFLTGNGRSYYTTIQPSALLMFYEAPFYFPQRDIQKGIMHFASFFESVEKLTSDPLEELDDHHEVKIDVKAVESQLRDVLRESVEVIDRMKHEIEVK